MTTYYRPLELKGEDGKPTGKWRVVEHNSSFTIVHGLCEHEHDSPEEAEVCPDAVKELARVFPPHAEPMMQFFSYDHLPEHLQKVSAPFAELARTIMELPRNPERTVALRKLLESKDCAVRAAIFK